MSGTISPLNTGKNQFVSINPESAAKLTRDYNTYQIHFKEFNLNETQFDHPGRLHGIMHTYRVMVHTLKLGLLTGVINQARLAFFAAYIHDMARTHDGYCTRHGADASEFKLPLYTELFERNGASSNDIKSISKAVRMHSINTEISKDDPDYNTVALLKDADALDRIRLGTSDLNPSFLRFSETHNCITLGEQLYYRSVEMKLPDFETLLALSLQIM